MKKIKKPAVPDEHERVQELLLTTIGLETEGRESCLESVYRDNPNLGQQLERLAESVSKPESVSNPTLDASNEEPQKDGSTEAPTSGESKHGHFESKPFPNEPIPSGQQRPPDYARDNLAFRTRAGVFKDEAQDAQGPQWIGPYAILRRIGKGGMGTVYLAQQENPKRQVALKLISKDRVSHEFLARFESEYQVLAQMNHNQIARLYEAGTTTGGDAYFTMEYAEGVPITQFCEERRLPIRERLHLFLRVCEGVLHAHQKAVVHRDLKPNNIMVTLDDKKPMVKIIDFGIAKDLKTSLSEKRRFETQAGTVIGTPAYMSPEQLGRRGEERKGDKMGVRGDIYSLGVILYKMLTGLHPLDPERFKKVPWDEVLRICREEEPPRPSERLRKAHALSRFGGAEPAPKKTLKEIKGDLDRIVMKAMDKDGSRRYATVEDLRKDIICFLNNQPVSARSPDLVYRVKKYVTRNKALVVSTAFTLIMLALGFFLVTWSLIQANRAKEKAFQAEIAANRAKEEAFRAEVESRIALQRFQVVNHLLQEILVATDPGGQGHETKIVAILKKAESQIQVFQEGDNLEATLRMALGKAYYGLGLYQDSSAHIEKALDIRLRELGEEHADTLALWAALAEVYEQLAPGDAGFYYRQAWELASEYHPDAAFTTGYGVRYADFLTQRARFKEARDLLLESYARACASDSPSLSRVSQSLVRLYRAWGQPAMAEHYVTTGPQPGDQGSGSRQ